MAVRLRGEVARDDASLRGWVNLEDLIRETVPHDRWASTAEIAEVAEAHAVLLVMRGAAVARDSRGCWHADPAHPAVLRMVQQRREMWAQWDRQDLWWGEPCPWWER